MRAESDDEAARHLSALACETHPAEYWYQYFTSSDTRLHIQFCGGDEIYLKGDIKHREDGPAVIRRDCHDEEWWNDGNYIIEPSDELDNGFGMTREA